MDGVIVNCIFSYFIHMKIQVYFLSIIPYFIRFV